MGTRPTDDAAGEITLRDVVDSDVEVFYQYQLDPEACEMAQFPARDREAYFALWCRIRGNDAIVKRTILCDGEVAGNIVSFLDDDGAREVGYWLGREFWGRGIATCALTQFLQLVRDRPLVAHASKGNIGSIRVLQKCGFTITAEDDIEYTLHLDP
jgi:RimJ/RimL family protein N-acetyltransferase